MSKAAPLLPGHHVDNVVDVERRKFGRRVRLGVNARVLYDAAADKVAARSQLAKPLGVLNGTTQFGRAPALSDDEYRLAAARRSDDPRNWGWRRLAGQINEDRERENARRRELNKGRTPDAFLELLPSVSHMAVKREFERRAVTKA